MLETSSFEFDDDISDRLVNPRETELDTTDDIDLTLRPKTLSEYLGQD
jgi:Holliday junction DNA helicase RuvB